MKIYCIIPAYNEEETISEVIKNVSPQVDKIVVVDDASVDNTYKLVKELNIGSLVCLRHIINRGQGAALQTGNEYAIKKEADLLVHFDADGQFTPEEIKDVIAPITTGEADIVFGSRFLSKKSNIPGFKKNIILPIARFINKFFLGVSLTDPQAGFRAMSAETAKKIKIKHDGMAHCSEIMYKAFRYKLKIKEVPVTIIYHSFGQRFSGGIKILKDLLLAKLIN